MVSFKGACRAGLFREITDNTKFMPNRHPQTPVMKSFTLMNTGLPHSSGSTIFLAYWRVNGDRTRIDAKVMTVKVAYRSTQRNGIREVNPKKTIRTRAIRKNTRLIQAIKKPLRRSDKPVTILAARDTTRAISTLCVVGPDKIP